MIIISKKWGVLAGVVLMFLIVLEIWSNNTMVAFGEKFEKISETEKILQLENQILENKIAKESSLMNIATASSQLGLTVPKSIQYLH